MVEIVSADNVDSDEPEPGLVASQLVAGSRMNAQHVRIDPGSGSLDPHRHPHEQITYVDRGTVTMVIDGDEHELNAGDSVLISGDTPHAAVNREDEPAVLVDVFSPNRDDLVD